MAPVAVSTESTPLASFPNLKAMTKPSQASPHTSLFHFTTAQPRAVSAKGLYITLEDGRTVLDGVSGGAAVASLGQGNQEVVHAMMDQASTVAYTYHQSVGCEAADKLATYLCNKGGFEAAAFLNSGE